MWTLCCWWSVCLVLKGAQRVVDVCIDRLVRQMTYTSLWVVSVQVVCFKRVLMAIVRPVEIWDVDVCGRCGLVLITAWRDNSWELLACRTHTQRRLELHMASMLFRAVNFVQSLLAKALWQILYLWQAMISHLSLINGLPSLLTSLFLQFLLLIISYYLSPSVLSHHLIFCIVISTSRSLLTRVPRVDSLDDFLKTFLLQKILKWVACLQRFSDASRLYRSNSIRLI